MMLKQKEFKQRDIEGKAERVKERFQRDSAMQRGHVPTSRVGLRKEPLVKQM
jgi:hypothetical protein